MVISLNVYMTMLAMTPQQGKEIKITHWFAEYGQRVLRFISSKINDLDEAEDIAQEVWYQLAKQNEIDDIQQIGSWLFTVARHRIINFYKKKKTIPFSDIKNSSADKEREDEVTDDVSFNQWVENSLPSEIVESAEFWDLLQRMLEKLPAEQREVFIENEMNDISFRELSEKTGISINTLLARKRYAVLKLKHEFEILFNQ